MMAALVNRSYLQASRPTWRRTWRATGRRPSGAACTTGARRSASPSVRPFRRRRIRARRRRAAADVVARRDDSRDDPHDGARRRELRPASFEFSLDPGTGRSSVSGTCRPARHLTLDVKTRVRHADRSARARRAARVVSEPVAPAGQRRAGARRPVPLDAVRSRHPSQRAGRRRSRQARARPRRAAPIPAFRVEMAFSGLRTTSWVTDTGDVVREESPLGLITVRESADRAQAMAVPAAVQADLLDAAAVVPQDDGRGSTIHATCAVFACDSTAPTCRAPISRAPARPSTATSSSSAIRGAAGRAWRPDAARYLAPEALIESDAPEILAEAAIAVRGVIGIAHAPSGSPGMSTICSKKSRPSAFRRRGKSCAPRWATATSTRRCMSRWRGRWASRRGSPSAWSSSTARSTTTRGRKCTSTRRGTPAPRLVAARRSDAQPVPRRRHARAPCARRPRQADRHSPADRTAEDNRPRPRAGARLHADSGRRASRWISARSRFPSRSASRAARASRMPSQDGPPMIAIHDLVKQYGTVHRRRWRQPRRDAGRDPWLSRARTAPARPRRSA